MYSWTSKVNITSTLVLLFYPFLLFYIITLLPQLTSNLNCTLSPITQHCTKLPVTCYWNRQLVLCLKYTASSDLKIITLFYYLLVEDTEILGSILFNMPYSFHLFSQYDTCSNDDISKFFSEDGTYHPHRLLVSGVSNIEVIFNISHWCEPRMLVLMTNEEWSRLGHIQLLSVILSMKR